MNIYNQKKKEEPKKIVSLTLEQLNILIMKSKEYINLDKQKKNYDAMQQENKLVSMLRAPQRNRKDEEIQIIKIVSLLNTIEAYDKAIIQINNIDQFKGQIISSQGDTNRVSQYIPYIASFCYYIENTNDLRGAADLKFKLNDYYGCDIANTFEKSVDPTAKTFFGVFNLQSPSVQKYAQDFSKKYQLLDVPGLNYQPQQYQIGKNQTQYPQPQQGGCQQQQGGFIQQQPQIYPSQQPLEQQQFNQSNNVYPNSQQINDSLQQRANPYGQLDKFNQQNIYQNNPNLYQPQISQPKIGLILKQGSNFDYPQQNQSIYTTPSQQQNNNIDFVPLKQQQQKEDPFAILNQYNSQNMVELPPLIKKSSIQSYIPLNKNGDGFIPFTQAPADEQVPIKSFCSQNQNETGHFAQNNPLGDILVSKNTYFSDPLSDQNQNIFQTTTLNQNMAISLQIMSNQNCEDIPLRINHDLRSLEILHKFKNGLLQSMNDSLNQLQIAVIKV